MKTKLTILVLTILLLLSVSFGQGRATSIEPLRYVAILSQHGPNAQTANVLYNTLGGTPTFSRMSAGYYAITLPNGFPAGRTTVIIPSHQDSLDDYAGGEPSGDGSTVYVFSFLPTGIASDDCWLDRHVEITVYQP